MSLDAIHETSTSEREHEDVEANCLAVVEARKELILELEELDESYWHVDESSGIDQCTDVDVPKLPPSKLKKGETYEKE